MSGEEKGQRLAFHGRRLEPEPTEQHAEPLLGGHLAMRTAPDLLRLLPAPEQGSREITQRERGRERSEGLMEMPGRRAHHAAVDLDLRQALALEEDEGVEEIEEDSVTGGGGHGSGLRWA